MRILVVGRGWTGKKMYYALAMRNHIVTVCSHYEAINEVISHTKYDYVVNCAGVTGTPNVDACEKDKNGTLLGNAIFPIDLYNACQSRNTRLAHFSSGCIYTGDIKNLYAEPNFFGSIYSISKGISDLYLRDRALVFRIRMPFTGSNEPKNYLTKVMNYAKNAKLIDAGANSMTDLDEAVDNACDIIEADSDNGYYNLVNQDSVTMHELAEIMGIKPEWFTPEEFKAATAAARSTCTIPAYKGMSPLRSALAFAVERMNLTK
jgi:nucleoside-diphosphate-sugar epimerase